MFAKLYGTGDDQILVMRDQTEEGEPAVKLFFKIRDVGMAANSFIYHEEEKADEAFAKVNEKEIRVIVKRLKKGLIPAGK